MIGVQGASLSILLDSGHKGRLISNNISSEERRSWTFLVLAVQKSFRVVVWFRRVAAGGAGEMGNELHSMELDIVISTVDERDENKWVLSGQLNEKMFHYYDYYDMCSPCIGL